MLWRLIAQLTELMPHLMRLVPMLDRMAGKGVPPELLNGLQQGMGDLNDSHHSLVNQLKDQNLQLASIQGKLEQLQLDSTRLKERTADLEDQLHAAHSRTRLLIWLVVFLLLANTAPLALFFLMKIH
jgi:hypothetical protein